MKGGSSEGPTGYNVDKYAMINSSNNIPIPDNTWAFGLNESAGVVDQQLAGTSGSMSGGKKPVKKPKKYNVMKKLTAIKDNVMKEFTDITGNIMKKPVVKKPVAKKPVAKKPVVKKPVVKKPVAKK